MNNLSQEKQIATEKLVVWCDIARKMVANMASQARPPLMTIPARDNEQNEDVYICNGLRRVKAILSRILVIEENSKRLLAALERAVELYGKEGGPWNVPGDQGSWISEARAAIKAAKG